MQDIHRELVDFGLKEAKAFKSEETGWIHFHHGKKEPPYQSIPFEENVLYILLLARTRTQEGVQEAKALLEKLLAYQVEGFFPSYLHDFPMTYDRFIGAKVLPPLFWLFVGFHTVLGEALSKKLAVSLFALAKRTLPEIPHMPLPLQMRAIASLHALERHFQGEISFQGLKQLPLNEIFQGKTADIPEDLADCLTALQLINDPEACSFKHWMQGRYHKTLKRWAGPFERIFFSKGEPERSVFDLYMAEIEGSVAHLKGMGIEALKAALIFPSQETDIDKELFASSQNTHIHESSVLSWTNRASKEKSHYCLSLIWGDAESLSTLFFQTREGKKVHFNGKDTLEISLEESQEGVSNDEARPLILYLREQEGVKILINNKPSTTFQMGDTVDIIAKKMKMTLQFSAEGGVFFGHIAKGNLPSEISKEEKGRFSANQWLIFLRSVDRGREAKIFAKLSFV